MPSCQFAFLLDDCGPPPQIANGTVSPLRTAGRSVAVYLCDFGFAREGKGVISCHDNGIWGRPPVCKPVQ